MVKRVADWMTERMLRWYGHVMKMNGRRTVRKNFVGECVGTRSAGKPRKGWMQYANK